MPCCKFDVSVNGFLVFLTIYFRWLRWCGRFFLGLSDVEMGGDFREEWNRRRMEVDALNCKGLWAGLGWMNASNIWAGASALGGSRAFITVHERFYVTHEQLIQSFVKSVILDEYLLENKVKTLMNLFVCPSTPVICSWMPWTHSWMV